MLCSPESRIWRLSRNSTGVIRSLRPPSKPGPMWPCSTSTCREWTACRLPKRSTRQVPSCQILVLTGLSQPGHLLRALKVHVRGFILKDAPAATLAQGVRRVAAGQRVIDPELLAASP